MPQPNKIPLPFAASGDKNTIPESTETTGLASWREGFPAITSAPFSEGGIAPKRADFNGIFNALSQAVMWLQQGGVYAYDVNTDYEAGNVVLDAGGLYVANAANGPSSAVVQPSLDTTGATWKLVRLDLATQAAAGYMSGADKTKLDGLISNDATQSAAGYMSASDKTKLDGLISTDATQSAAGYMSAADKTKLDGLISTNATRNAAGYMSAADKTALDGVPTTYLPLSGGTITGSIYAPTPSTSDSSTKIATTAFVNNLCCGPYKSLGDNYVMNINDFDKIGVHYTIGSLSTSVEGNYPASDNVGDWDLVAFRGGLFLCLLGVTPRTDKLYLGRFWNGSFNGWRVI